MILGDRLVHVKPLKVFCDVVGRRSFSRAAGENGISQSGASQIVHQLEERLGVKLLDRSKRPFVLTPEGEVFYEGCRKLVRRYQALEEEVRTLHEEVAGRVSVASIYSAGLTHLSRFVKEFLRRYPKANVRVEYQHPARVYELVEASQADLGLVSYPKGSRTVKATSWCEEPMVLVCSPDHPWAKRNSVALSELDHRDMVGFDEDLTIRREIDRALATCRAEANVVMAFDNIETLKQAVEINAGVSLLPEPTVAREVQLGLLKVVRIEGGAFTRPLGIIQRRGAQTGKTARRFLQFLRETGAASASSEDGDGRARGAPGTPAGGGNGRWSK